MESITFVGQKTNPFIFNMNLKELEKNKMKIEKENENEYLSAINLKNKNEILALKNYIQKMNSLIRKEMNMEIPSLEEGFEYFSKKIKEGEEHSEIFQDTINEWINKILNVDYFNPLILLYDNYIKNLEDELKNSKEKIKKYENIINKLVNENNELRNQVQISEEELKNFLEIRNENLDSMIIMDRDYMIKLEERNKLLSKENEILIVNFNRIQNELIQMKNNNGNMSNIQNDMKYKNLNEKYLKLNNEYKDLQGQYNITNQKLFEFADKNNKLENDKFILENKNDNFKPNDDNL